MVVRVYKRTFCLVFNSLSHDQSQPRFFTYWFLGCFKAEKFIMHQSYGVKLFMLQDSN